MTVRGSHGSLPEIVSWAAVVVCLGVAVALEPKTAAAVLAASLAVLTWLFPRQALEVGVVSLFCIRPSLDAFSERSLGLGAFAFNPAVVFGASILVLVSVLVVRRTMEGRPLWPDKQLALAHFWLGCAYAVGLVSGTVLHGGAGLGIGIREWLRMSSVVGGFLLVLWWSSDPQFRYRRGVAYLVVGIVPPIAAAIWQLVTVSGNLEVPGINRLQGTFSHPHTLGPFLVPLVLMTVAGMMSAGVVERLQRLLVAVGLSVILAMTFSRTALLVLLVGLAVMPALQVLKFGRQAITRGASAVVVFALIGWLVAGDYVRSRFSGLRVGAEALDAARTGNTESSLEWRLVNWGVLIQQGMERPVAGNGLGMTTVLNPLLDPATGLPYTAHNDFVRVFFEDGIVGLVCYLCYGIFLVGWSLRSANRAAPETSSPAFAAASALLALFFLSAGTAEFGTQTAVQFEVFSMLALLTAGSVHSAPESDS